MSILYLGRAEPKILAELMTDDVTITAGELVEGYDYGNPRWVICNGYRHIIRWPFIEKWYGGIINIHISLLPWNRGAAPNLWSWYDDTPRGVSIHLIEDERVDTGRLVAQCKVDMSNELTLEESYFALQDVATDLFIDQWKYIKMGTLAAADQIGVGTVHTVKQSDVIYKRLKQKFKTKCSEVQELGRADRERAGKEISTGRGGSVVDKEPSQDSGSGSGAGDDSGGGNSSQEGGGTGLW